MFEALGLDRSAELVYLTLLEHPDADVACIAAEIGLREEEVRKALDTLVEMSLLRVSRADPRIIQPVDPGAGLAALVARREQELEQSKRSLTELLAKYERSRTRAVEPGIVRLEGIDTIRDRLDVLAKSCEWEACSLMPGGAQSEESIKASRRLDADAIDRGVHLRTVYLDSVRNDPATLAYADWLTSLGSEVRTAPTLPMRLLIVDRKIAIVPVDPHDTSAAAIEVVSEGIIAGLVALFRSVWRTAVPLGAPRRRDDRGLSAQDRQVLYFLAAGLTDEMIARRLAVSGRTVRRIASELLARLGARSRFQAGARAVARDWLRPDDLD